MPKAELRLVVLPVSPWSERVLWAMDHHQLSYERIPHTPFLGERRLRRLVGKEQATVPALLTAEKVLSESWDIARHADQLGAGPKLFPPEREEELRRWNELADEVMSVMRLLVTSAILASPRALDETQPRVIPVWLRPLLRPLARHGVKWFARKYDLQLDDTPAQEERLRSLLETLRDALAKTSPYLPGAFSYADIVMATCLQGISPVDARYIPLGPATRRAWTRETMAADFADLIAWRDRLYEQHRRAPSAGADM